MKRLVGALAFLGVSAAASGAMAQEIQIRGPLAGASSCRHCVQYRTGRLSVTPTFGITLQEEYDRAMFLGANIQFHVNDIFAIGVWGSYAIVHIPTALTSGIQQSLTDSGMSTANIPNGSQFGQQIGQLNWIVSAPQLTLIPLRGKLSLFENFYIDTDFYIFAGLGIIGLTERADYDAANEQGMTPEQIQALRIASQTGPNSRASRVAFTGTFGVGLNFYINHFVSLSFEYRAFPFSWNTSGTDENSNAMTCGATGMTSCAGFPDYQVQADANGGGRFKIDAADQSFHWNQMVQIGINIFLPPSAHIGE